MLISLDQLPQQNGEVEIGELIAVVIVNSANVVRDLRENIRNLIGGRMSHYEQMIQEGVDAALAALEEKATARGYDGVIGVKITNPNVVDGGVEIIVYGNGFRYRRPLSGAQSS